MSDQEMKVSSAETQVKEIRKGVLYNETPKPPMPAIVTSSTGQSASTQVATTTPAVSTKKE